MSRTPKSTRSNRAPAATGAAGLLPNRLRIIGGRWRGTRITFPPLPMLRPSADRVRETVFNWLQPVIAQSRCLDLFAGSGALGIEALSRGASHVDFVDSDPRVSSHLQATLGRLGANNCAVRTADALEFLKTPARPYDVVFLDPPFASDLLARVCDQLARGGWLASQALVYVECPADRPLPQLPASWQLHRTKRAGQVGYHLLRT